MPRGSMQDMLPQENGNNKKTIRQVTIDRTETIPRSVGLRRTLSRPPKPAPMPEAPRPMFTDAPVPHKEHKERRPVGMWAVAGVALLALLFVAGSYIFQQARVVVIPRTAPVTVQGTFVATKDAPTGELAFQTMTITHTAERTIPATGQKQLDQKASGQIIVYNNYSTASQRLIKNTRFETSGGLMYRINESITVPGRTTVKGEVIPGSVEVTVFADVAGAQYNIGLVDFTIPGFKDDPRFYKFYARSKTPMVGGFSGTVKTAAESDLTQAKTDIEKELREKLETEAEAQLPPGYAILKNATQISFTNLPAATSTPADTTVKVGEQGTLSAYIVDQNALSNAIARTTIADYNNEPVRIKDMNDLRITAGTSTTNGSSVPLNVSGTSTLVWLFNEDALRTDLTGKPKKDTPAIFSGYPGIQSATVTIRPFWKQTLPTSKADIVIESTVPLQ